VIKNKPYTHKVYVFFEVPLYEYHLSTLCYRKWSKL